MQQNSRQHYRKELTSKGLIFLLGVEMEMVVRNISITGLLGEIEINDQLRDIKHVFEAIKESTIVDVYLEKLRLAGEAEVVRVDMVEDRLSIALEFKNISYDVNNLLYKRKAYRKGMTAPGRIKIAGKIYDFMTRNVSVEGLMIRIPEQVEVKEGDIVPFDFERLELSGEIKIIWFAYDEDGGTLMGLQYIYMENTKVKGIPRFTR